MTEQIAVADSLEEVVPGVRHWHISDGRIGGFISSAQACATRAGGWTLIDPLPLDAPLLETLDPVESIVITSGSHQRAAWSLRGRLGAPVYAPALSQTLAEEPDERYGDGDSLGDQLSARFTPGAGTTQHTLVLGGPQRVAFVPDLLARPPGRELQLVPEVHMADPALARESIGGLIDLKLDVLCLAHGVPVTGDVSQAIRRALER